jgi:hypothetical protein
VSDALDPERPQGASEGRCLRTWSPYGGVRSETRWAPSQGNWSAGAARRRGFPTNFPFGEGKATLARNAVVFAVDLKAVQVGITPTHGDLNGVREVGDAVAAAQERSAPDHRTDAAQNHLELVNAWRLRAQHGTFINMAEGFPRQGAVDSAAPGFLCSP